MGFAPHTSQLHVTERYRRRDFGHLEVQGHCRGPRNPDEAVDAEHGVGPGAGTGNP
jgi:hypothetical protein